MVPKSMPSPTASRTPLMIAARRFGGAPIVKLLLDKGADPNPNTKPTTESSPLLEAAISDVLPLDVMKLLILRGAHVNARDRHTKSGDAGLTVLDIARNNGNTPIVELLVKSGAKASPEAPVALKPGVRIPSAMRFRT